MKNKINWGIIALGDIANKFASDLQLVNDANLLAVASRDKNKSKTFAKKFGAGIAYNSYEELVQNPDIDIVYIASPHTFHFEHSMLCLKHNKNVLCEKPIGINASQVSELSKYAKNQSLFLMEALWTRFTPSFIKCRELIDKNKIGDIKLIHADFGFRAPDNTNEIILKKELGGGSLLDIGIYPVFLALSLLGEPEEIIARAKFGKTDVDLTTSILFNYPSKGATALLSSTFEAETPKEANISGSEGRIKMMSRWYAATALELVKNGENKIYDFSKAGLGYQYEIQEVHQCLKKKMTESKLFSLEHSYILHKTLDRIRAQIGLIYHDDKK